MDFPLQLELKEKNVEMVATYGWPVLSFRLHMEGCSDRVMFGVRYLKIITPII